MLLNDREISALCDPALEHPMISPFAKGKVKKNDAGQAVISYGCSEFGYDARIGDQFAFPKNIEKGTVHTVLGKSAPVVTKAEVLDPKRNSDSWETITKTDPFQLQPNSFILGTFVEQFWMPEDVLGMVVDKSTYSRIGLAVPSAILEPGWNGSMTIRLANTSPHPIMIYPYEGIVQILFFRGTRPADVYGSGKYQGAQGVVTPKV